MLEQWQIEEIQNYWNEEIDFPCFQQHRTIERDEDVKKFSALFIWILRKNGGTKFTITKESEIKNIMYVSEEEAKLLLEVLQEMYL